METISAPSSECYNSHQNITVVLIIEHFKVISHERPRDIDLKRAKGLFEEDEIKNYVKAMRKDFITSMLECSSK